MPYTAPPPVRKTTLDGRDGPVAFTADTGQVGRTCGGPVDAFVGREGGLGTPPPGVRSNSGTCHKTGPRRDLRDERPTEYRSRPRRLGRGLVLERRHRAPAGRRLPCHRPPVPADRAARRRGPPAPRAGPARRPPPPPRPPLPRPAHA